jgi:hypothetical protein
MWYFIFTKYTYIHQPDHFRQFLAKTCQLLNDLWCFFTDFWRKYTSVASKWLPRSIYVMTLNYIHRNALTELDGSDTET